MGFLATSKARSARSLASASTPASRHPISTRSGCSCGSCESSWNAVAGRRSSLSKRSSPDLQAAPGERPSTRRCAAARDRHHPERNLPISGPAASLRVIFHTVAAHAPKRNILFKCSRWSSSTATTLPCPGRAGSLLRCQPTTVLAGRSAGQNAILPRVDIAGRSYQIHNVEPSLRRETTREMWYELSDVRTWRIDWRSPWTPSDRRHDGVVPRPPA